MRRAFRPTVKTATGAPVAAGVILKAADTGRVLLLQRALDETDPQGGRWEWPGGHVDPGEHPHTAGCREFGEEVGTPVPPTGRLVDEWDSSNGIYRSHLIVIPEESHLPINLGPSGRWTQNPDDPDGDSIETVAFWDPAHLRGNPGLRDEMVGHTPWARIEAAEYPPDTKAARPDAKVSKTSVHYRTSFSPAQCCGTCVMYHAGTCGLVAGRVEVADVCDRWEGAEAKTVGVVRVGGRRVAVKYSEDQPRDDHGRFGDGSGDVTGRLEAGGKVVVAPEHLGGLLRGWASRDTPIDMARLSVTGPGNENLFDRSTLGLPRDQMPVIPSTGDAVYRFDTAARNAGYDTRFEQADPRTLTATQGELDGRKVGYLLGRLDETNGADQRVIVVDRDGNIVDGTHRWAANAAYAADHPDHQVPVLRVDAGLDNVLAVARQFSADNGIESRPFGQYGQPAADIKAEHHSHGQYREVSGAFGKTPEPPKTPYKDPQKDPTDPRPEGAPRLRGGWRVSVSGFRSQHPDQAAWVREGDTIHRFGDGHVEVAHLDGTWTQFHPAPDGGSLRVSRRWVPPPPEPETEQVVGRGGIPKTKPDPPVRGKGGWWTVPVGVPGLEIKYDDNQERDDRGRWTDSGGSTGPYGTEGVTGHGRLEMGRTADAATAGRDTWTVHPGYVGTGSERTQQPLGDLSHLHDTPGRLLQLAPRVAQVLATAKTSMLPGDVHLTAEALSHQADQLNSQRQIATQPMTAQEAQDRQTQVVGMLDGLVKAGYTTVDVYRNPVSGTYTRDRMDDQDRHILEPFYDRVKTVPADKEALVMAGLPGAGKTTVLQNFGDQLGYNPDDNTHITLNADDVKEQMLAAGMGLSVPGLSPLETASLLHRESSDLMKTEFADALSRGKNMVLDITMNDPANDMRTKYLDALTKAGYKVTLVMVSTTPADSLKSAGDRWRKGENEWLQGDPGAIGGRLGSPGGRFVPPAVVTDHVLPGDGLGPGQRSVAQTTFWDLVQHQGMTGMMFDRTNGTMRGMVYDSRRGDPIPAGPWPSGTTKHE